jgi:hypothetical protein
MITYDASNDQSAPAGRGRIRRWLAPLAGFVGLIAGLGMSVHSAPAGQVGQGSAPAAWQEFGVKIQATLNDRLNADDDATRELHRLLEVRTAGGASIRSVVTRIWVTEAGNIDRLEFDGADNELAANLRNVLTSKLIGIVPPPGMRQPVNLRLSLRDTD